MRPNPSLRLRLTLIAAAAVAVAVSLGSIAAYVATRVELRRQVDADLASEAAKLNRLSITDPAVLGALPTSPIPQDTAVQLVRVDGAAFSPRGQAVDVPFGSADVAVAAGQSGRLLRDARSSGVHLRLITVPTGRPGLALQVATPLTRIDHTLTRLGFVLVLVGVGGVTGAAALGLGVARAGLAPVDRFAAAAEHVAATEDLTALPEPTGDDEVARLGRSFNAMLAALDRSRAQQRQLVADAGHELRTPLASLRNNIELLARSDAQPGRLSAEDRAALLGDLTAQLTELGVLVDDLVELARDEPADQAPERVAVAAVVARAVERVRLRAPAGLTFDVATDATVVDGYPALLERAVLNLLDNAVKWSPAGGTVTVRLDNGELTVADEGPGIPAADLPHVFDRFYRSPSSRGLPGSGLGLAIVRRAAEAHHGAVTAALREPCGTVLRLRLPQTGGPSSLGGH